MARYRELLSLMTEQREELRRWAQSRSLPAGDLFRGRLILALAGGMTYGAIHAKDGRMLRRPGVVIPARVT